MKKNTKKNEKFREILLVFQIKVVYLQSKTKETTSKTQTTKQRKGLKMETTNTASKQVSMNSIECNTMLYEREYGKSPKGRGSWAFSIGSKEGYEDVTKAFFTNSMTYKEAVKVAKKEAQQRGATIIYVLP